MATIKLFKNIPWGTDNLHVLRFPSLQAQQAYFDGLEGDVKTINYDPRRGSVLQFEASITDAQSYNYMQWTNENGEVLYFFITGYEYLNDYPTAGFFIEEDIWQNCHLKMQINPSTVHRRHMARWSSEDPNYPLLYPVDEGNPRSYSSHKIWQLSFPGDIIPIMFVTNKVITAGQDPNKDKIMQYVSFINKDGSSVNSETTPWLNPFSAHFTDDVVNFKLATSDLLACYVLPILPENSYYVNGNTVTLNTSPTNRYFSYVIGSGDQTATLAQFYQYNLRTISKQIPISILKPQKGTETNTASYLYEPQAWSDNVMSIGITDFMGNVITSIPKNIAWQSLSLTIYGEYQAVTPNARVGITGGDIPAGTQFIISLPAIDMPQSPWADYLARDRTADKQILENSIKANYYNALASGLTGGVIAGSVGWGTNAMYYPKRSAALGAAIGAGAGAISLVGSLASAYVRDKTDRDNFALNEQKIKNSSAPPIGGNNLITMLNNNLSVIQLTADDLSHEIITNNYIANGVIVDKFGEVPLRTRYYYDYIQTKNVSISGEITNDRREYLEDLFNSGVTVWHSETFRGIKYDLNNIEVT